jgi:hypothetical protein
VCGRKHEILCETIPTLISVKVSYLSTLSVKNQNCVVASLYTNVVFICKEEFYRLGYKAVWSSENYSTFRRNILPPSTGW